MVSPVSRASLEYQDNKDYPVVMEPLVPRDRLESQEFRVLGAQQDQEDQLDHRDLTESSELQEVVESLDFRDHKDPTERKD